MFIYFADFNQIAPNDFLSPFLEVIRSEDTTGPITGLALTSVNKFLSYGMIGRWFMRKIWIFTQFTMNDYVELDYLGQSQNIRKGVIF